MKYTLILLVFLLGQAQTPEHSLVPSQEDAYRPFGPPWSPAGPYPNLKSCLVSPNGPYNGRSEYYQTMKNNNGVLATECRPDTLYSWGDENKINGLKKVMGTDQWAPQLERALYLARSPVTTIGYGPYAVRVKLRAGVQFKRIDKMIRCNDEEIGQERTSTVYYRNDFEYADWTICSPQVIHSWSYDTEEMYSELIKEKLMVDYLEETKQSPIGIIDFYAKWQEEELTPFINSEFDNQFFHIEIFQTTTRNMLDRVLAHRQGHIFYNSALPAAERTPEKHFATEHPSHYNEK